MLASTVADDKFGEARLASSSEGSCLVSVSCITGWVLTSTEVAVPWTMQLAAIPMASQERRIPRGLVTVDVASIGFIILVMVECLPAYSVLVIKSI